MGGFMEWATSSLSMKRRKPEQQTVDELESATKELDRSCKRFEEARMCQENIARLLRQQLATLRRHIANTTDEEVKTALIEQERLLRDMYEQAKRELKDDYYRLTEPEISEPPESAKRRPSLLRRMSSTKSREWCAV